MDCPLSVFYLKLFCFSSEFNETWGSCSILRARDSMIRHFAVGISDLGQIKKTVTIFFQLSVEIEYKNQIKNLTILLS